MYWSNSLVVKNWFTMGLDFDKILWCEKISCRSFLFFDVSNPIGVNLDVTLWRIHFFPGVIAWNSNNLQLVFKIVFDMCDSRSNMKDLMKKITCTTFIMCCNIGRYASSRFLFSKYHRWDKREILILRVPNLERKYPCVSTRTSMFRRTEIIICGFQYDITFVERTVQWYRNSDCSWDLRWYSFEFACKQKMCSGPLQKLENWRTPWWKVGNPTIYWSFDCVNCWNYSYETILHRFVLMSGYISLLTMRMLSLVML